MAVVNEVRLLGNVTRDPELKYTPGGTAVCEVGLAMTDKWTDKTTGQKKEETTFVDITLWGRTAEICCEFVRKGNPLYVAGKLRLDQWDDRQTGAKRSKLKVNGESIQLLGNRKPEDQRPANSDYGEEPQTAPAVKPDAFAGEDVPF